MARVVITGGSGMLGRGLIPALLARHDSVAAFSRSEKGQLALRAQYPDVEWRVGDVCDRGFLRTVFCAGDTVIHAAALKHVDLSERESEEYVRVNVEGTRNVMDAAREACCERVIGISTDKACEPRNVYGLTKLLMERMFAAARRGRYDVRFCCVRYGNVFGSDGSVVPRWREALARGERLTLTNPDMTRFFFRIGDAVHEVLWALSELAHGEVSMPQLHAARLGDLAAAMGGEVVVTGLRAGEKRDEVLISAHERAIAALVEGRMVMGRGTSSRGAYESSSAPRLSVAQLRQWIGEL